ncbi:MAG: ABC transporter ATP-binding protein [Burkholderiaceae bacterium]
MPSLRTDALTIRFGGHVAVDAVSCAFHPGELTVVVGPTGPARPPTSTSVSRPACASAGSVHLGRRDITRLSAARRARLGLGRAFQLTNLFPGLTVLENVRLVVQSRLGLGARFWRSAGAHRAVTDEAHAVLEQTRLGAQAGAITATLSHGDQRKLEVAMMVAMQPSVFMFDEPTAGMSLDDAPIILELIEQIRRDASRTILLVEHKMDVVRQLADRIVVLHNGRLIADGEPGEVMASTIVREVYLGGAPEQESA